MRFKYKDFKTLRYNHELELIFYHAIHVIFAAYIVMLFRRKIIMGNTKDELFIVGKEYKHLLKNIRLEMVKIK